MRTTNIITQFSIYKFRYKTIYTIHIQKISNLVSASILTDFAYKMQA